MRFYNKEDLSGMYSIVVFDHIDKAAFYVDRRELDFYNKFCAPEVIAKYRVHRFREFLTDDPEYIATFRLLHDVTGAISILETLPGFDSSRYIIVYV